MTILLRTISLLVLLFVFSQTAWGTCALSSKDVQKSIDKDGAKKVLWAFGANDDAHWASFTDCVRTGEKEWLHIAVEVAPFRDGFVGEDLALALGRALSVNARNVLQVAVPTYGFDEFCGSLTNDYPPDEPYLKDLDDREKGLDKVKDLDLLTAVDQCRKVIKQVRDYVKTHNEDSPETSERST